jgi:hypothetical protein
MKKGLTNALESTFMGLCGPINCQRQGYSKIIVCNRFILSQKIKMTSDYFLFFIELFSIFRFYVLVF